MGTSCVLAELEVTRTFTSMLEGKTRVTEAVTSTWVGRDMWN